MSGSRWLTGFGRALSVVAAVLLSGCSGERSLDQVRADHRRAVSALEQDGDRSQEQLREIYGQRAHQRERLHRDEFGEFREKCQQELEIAEDQCEFEIEEVEKELKAAREKRWESWRAELRDACGGRLAGIRYDPTLSIGAMLRTVGQAVAPRDCEVSVWAWQFVEYQVHFRRREGFTHEEAALIAKTFLAHSAEQAYRIEFKKARRIQFVVNREAIRGAVDWNGLPLAEVMKVVEKY